MSLTPFQLVAESFYVLHHTNVTALNPCFGGAPGGGPVVHPIDALAGRPLRFSIDFEY